MFLAFRFIAGASAFMILAAVPILMNEIVPVHLRGALVDIHAVMLVLGYTIQGWVGFGFYASTLFLLPYSCHMALDLTRVIVLEIWQQQHVAPASRHSMPLPALPAYRTAIHA
jgi:MFS family permease